ncbi:MAG: 4-hydroxy-tetrahydrodipicolinate reductase [Phycisphaerae bacterium]
MIQLAITGGFGRLGGSILNAAVAASDFDVVASLVRAGDSRIGHPHAVDGREVRVTDRLDGPCDVVIDSSSPGGMMTWLDVCERASIPFVTGVTGLDDSQRNRLVTASTSIPVLIAPNYSVGMRIVVKAAAELAARLGEDFDIEIVEAHHKRKVDAPSGSALAILDSILEATGRDRGCCVHGRDGETGPRPKGEIGVHAVRMGGVVGQHEVHFGGEGEVVTLSHFVQSRDTFAHGALRAARWIREQGPGLYSMDDVLGLSGSSS